MTIAKQDAVANTNNAYSIDRDFAATIRRQSWSQTRAIERRIENAVPVWTCGDNGASEPWDWIHGNFTAIYLLPKYGYIAYHLTGAAGTEAVETEDGGYVGGSALYALEVWSTERLIDDDKNRRRRVDIDEHLHYNAAKLVHSHK